MNQQDAIDWFESLVQEGQKITDGGATMGTYHQWLVNEWVTKAGSAVEAVFPKGHAVTRTWVNALSPGLNALAEVSLFRGAVAVVQAGLDLLQSGRITTLIDGIRAETIEELLQQAGVLFQANHEVAAAVIGGGALETHLLHLCDRNNITWDGSGSINVYNDAIARERKQGNEVYAKSYGSLITGWGQIRNDAAHTPGEFGHSTEEVRSMLEGIRQFVTAVP